MAATCGCWGKAEPVDELVLGRGAGGEGARGRGDGAGAVAIERDVDAIGGREKRGVSSVQRNGVRRRSGW